MFKLQSQILCSREGPKESMDWNLQYRKTQYPLHESRLFLEVKEEKKALKAAYALISYS